MLVPAQNKTRDWTILYYGGAVNNLEPSIRKAWENLGEEDVPENVDIFVRHFDEEGHSQDVYLGQDGEKQILASSPKRIDTSDPETLSEFFRDGVSKYPARRYLAIVSSHGRGAEGVVEDDLQSEIMKPAEFTQALNAGKEANDGRPIDVVLFDACRMAAVEMATEMAGSSLVSVASMDSIANMGYDLADVARLTSASRDAKELGQKLVSYEDQDHLDAFNSISAVDLTQLDKLQKSFRDLATKLQTLGPDSAQKVRTHMKESRRNRPSPISEYGNDLLADSILQTPDSDNSDALEMWLENEKPGEAVAIVSFCSQLLSDKELMERHPNLGDIAVSVIEAHDAAVYASTTQDQREDPGGLTVLMPLKNEVGPLYDSPLKFAQQTKWEVGYNAVLPDGDEIQTEKTWLERELELTNS